MTFLQSIPIALLLLSKCTGLDQPKKMSSKPLICNPDSGFCEIPESKETKNSTQLAQQAKQKPIRILYFTDPICSSCWGIEPQLRRLKAEYGDYVQIEYRMGGLLQDWSYNSGGISKPSDVAEHWDQASRYYEMPIDGDVWLEDPLPSSYPPSIAFKAAQLQDEEKSLAFLRRIREMVFLEKKNITRWEYLEKAAKETGLDSDLLKKQMGEKALQAFKTDLELTRTMGVRGFPTLLFSDAFGKHLTLYGSKPYAQFEQTMKALLPEGEKKEFETSAEALFARFPTLTSQEFAILSGKSKLQAEKELNHLFEKKNLQKTSTKNGSLWIWKTQ